jgi:hypothetical protein
MMAGNQTTTSIVTGPKGGGKTFTAREIISLHPRILALDPHGGEFALPGALAVRSREQLFEAMKANWKRPCWLIVMTPDFDVEDASEAVAFRAFERVGCLAVFDEAHAYMSAGQLGDEMGRLTMQARHRRVNLCFCSPRLADLATDVRTQTDAWIVCGNLWTKADLDAVEEHTSTEFRRACQEPVAPGEYRRLGFDTRTRQQFDVTRPVLRDLFRVPKIPGRETYDVQRTAVKRKWWDFDFSALRGRG